MCWRDRSSPTQPAKKTSCIANYLGYVRLVFEGCLYFNGTALARLLERQWAQAFAPFDLSPPQGFMVRLVLERPGLLQRELAEALTISRPTATRLLDGLEKKGLIRRRIADGDRRECQILPTPGASKLGPGLNAASGQVTKRLKQLLGSEVFEEAVMNIRRVSSSLKV